MLGPEKTPHTLPLITATQLSDRAKWRGGTHGLDGWRYKELRLLPNASWELLAHFFNALEGHAEPVWPPALPVFPKKDLLDHET